MGLVANEFVSLLSSAVASGEALQDKKMLHQDSAFMIEILLRVYTDALGDVNNPFAAGMASTPQMVDSENGEGGLGSEVRRRFYGMCFQLRRRF